MMIENLIRKNILSLKPYTSARDQYSEGILLDANENSFGTVVQGFEFLHLNRYPDPHQNDLKKLIGSYFDVPYEKLFFGVGSDEIIDLLIRIFCEPGTDSVMIPEPTYGMYKVACDINNVNTVAVTLNNEFQIDFDNISNNYNKSVKLIFLCSPNNPTGNLLQKADILRLCSEYDSIIVVDEAYADFAGLSLLSEIDNYPNLVILRTLSKAWGLAGIRLGFSIADKLITDYLFKVKAPYNISSLTRFAVEQALSNSAVKDNFIQKIIAERERIKNALCEMKGIQKVFHSDANFILFRCNNASNIQLWLAEKGIIIRNRSTQVLLENCLRISVGTEEENNRFLEEISKLL